MDAIVESSARRFRVTFVCTANRARSPFASALLERNMAGLRVSCRSFGVDDVGPLPALSEAVWAASALGVDLGGHVARPIRRGDLSHDDLVIGFEPFHLAAAVVEGGAARGRVFLLTELAELLGGMPLAVAERRTLRDLVELVHSVRGGPAPTWASIADPRGRSRHDVLEIFELIDAQLAPIVRKFVASGRALSET